MQNLNVNRSCLEGQSGKMVYIYIYMFKHGLLSSIQIPGQGLIIEIRHTILIQCPGNYIEVEKL